MESKKKIIRGNIIINHTFFTNDEGTIIQKMFQDMTMYGVFYKLKLILLSLKNTCSYTQMFSFLDFNSHCYKDLLSA